MSRSGSDGKLTKRSRRSDSGARALDTGVNSPAVGEAARPWYERDDLLFALGAAAWLVVMILKWPCGLSYSDEIGYVGQAKLFLQGHIRWIPGAPGIWNPTPHGVVAQYPLLVPLLLAPLFAIAPTAIFVIGVIPALALAWIGSRILKSWGASPCWALIFLAHPTIVILAQTAMSDLLLSAFALGSWWALHNRRSGLAIASLALTMASRPTGIPIAAAIIAGDLIEKRLHRPFVLGAIVKEAQAGIIGFALGMILVLASNVLTTGTLRFGYNYRPGIPSFRAAYLLKSGPAHLQALLVNPPLLLLGLVPLWRRRLWAPLLAVATMGTLMCFYVWVDWGPTWLETVVLSERLILPIVAIMLVGYAAGLSRIAARLRVTSVARVALVIVPALVAFKIGSRHRLWQEPMQEARSQAARLVHQMGSNELGLNYQSSKAGLLFPGKTIWVGKDSPRPAVLLCSTRGNSYRDLTSGNPGDGHCDRFGYTEYRQARLPDGFMLMLRDDVQLPNVPSPDAAGAKD